MKAKCTETGPVHEDGGAKRGWHVVKGTVLDGDVAKWAVKAGRAEEVKDNKAVVKGTV